MRRSFQIPDPRIFTKGPHIDCENPAYPADSVVARLADEARRHADTLVRRGASVLKIYFRLPFASAKAVIDVCETHYISVHGAPGAARGARLDCAASST